MDIVTVRTDRQMDNVPDGTSDEENEALDPRIQVININIIDFRGFTFGF